MYASPYGEGLSIKRTYFCAKNGSNEERWLKSYSGGGSDSVREGLLLYTYLYLSGGGGSLLTPILCFITLILVVWELLNYKNIV